MITSDCKLFAANINVGLSNALPFLRESGCTDAESISALLVDLTGSRNAGLMMSRLIYWWPRAKKFGGWVYKSWRNWQAELRLSRDQVKLVHSKGYLESVGVKRKVMKANGAPTIHYLLDVGSFLRRLAEFASVSVERLLAWMEGRESHQSIEGKATNSNEDIPPMEEGETHQSITELYQTSQNKHISTKQQTAVVVSRNRYETENKDLPVVPGTSSKTVKGWIEKYGLDRVKAVIQYAKRQKNVKNLPGFVAWELKNNILGLHKPKEERRYITGSIKDFIRS